MNQRYTTYYKALENAVAKRGDASVLCVTEAFGKDVLKRLVHEAGIWCISEYGEDKLKKVTSANKGGLIWLVFNYLSYAQNDDRLSTMYSKRVLSGGDTSIVQLAKELTDPLLYDTGAPLWFASYLPEIQMRSRKKLAEMVRDDNTTYATSNNDNEPVSSTWITSCDKRGRKARYSKQLNGTTCTVPLSYDRCIKHDRLRIPVSIVTWAVGSRTRMKDLLVYMLLKSACNGYIDLHDSDKEISEYIMEGAGWSDKRTLNKALDRLQQRNWIGRDTSKEKAYWIRSTARVIRETDSIETKKTDSAHVFSVEDFLKMDSALLYSDNNLDTTPRITTVWRTFIEHLACAHEYTRRQYVQNKFSEKNKERISRRSNPNCFSGIVNEPGDELVSYNSEYHKTEYAHKQDRFDLDLEQELYSAEHMSVSLIAEVIDVGQGTAHKRKIFWDMLGLACYAHSVYDTMIDTGHDTAVLNQIKSMYDTCGYKMFIDNTTGHILVNLTDAIEFDTPFKRVVF